MCTLGILLGQSPRFPLIVAANRDESRHRATRAPHVWDSHPSWVAGLDEKAGGTWMGVNEHGVFAGITNLWTGHPADSRRASRGNIVTSALKQKTLEGAMQWVRAQDASATNPYILVVADARGRGFWCTTEQRLEIHSLAPGHYAIGNVVPEDPPQGKLAGLTDELRRLSEVREGASPQWRHCLQRALATHSHDRGPRSSVCVHTEGEYGTVSSTILLLDREMAGSHLFYATGPPCENDFEDLSRLMKELS